MAKSPFARLFQRPRIKYLLLVVILACLSLIIYHSVGGKQSPTPASQTVVLSNPEVSVQIVEQVDAEVELVKVKIKTKLPCDPVPPLKNVNINTPDVYPALNFKPPYRSYWNYTFEKRYLKTKENWDKLPLHVSTFPFIWFYTGVACGDFKRHVPMLGGQTKPCRTPNILVDIRSRQTTYFS